MGGDNIILYTLDMGMVIVVLVLVGWLFFLFVKKCCMIYVCVGMCIYLHCQYRYKD